MTRTDWNFWTSLLLLILILLTALLGYIQSELELRKFVPHRYLAYATLVVLAVHLYFNFGKIWRYLRRRKRRRRGTASTEEPRKKES